MIGDNAHLLAQLSAVFAKKNCYLPTMDGPRLQRPDAISEVIRRNNAVAAVQAEKIIFVDLPEETCKLFSKHFPPSKTHRIANLDEARALGIQSNVKADSQPLIWGRENIGLGLLQALYERREIVFQHDTPSPRTAIPSLSGYWVICEDNEELSQVIAANYAYSIGAGLHLISSVSEEIEDEILERFYNLYDIPGESPSDILTLLKETLRGHVGEALFNWIILSDVVFMVFPFMALC